MKSNESVPAGETSGDDASRKRRALSFNVDSQKTYAKAAEDALSSAASTMNAIRSYSSVVAESYSIIGKAMREACSYYNSPAYREAIEAMRRGVLESAKVAQALVQSISRESLAALSESYKTVVGKARFTRVLEKSEWPLYLVDDVGLIERIKLIDPDESKEAITPMVREAAIEHLGLEWIEETRARWAGYEELSPGTKALLDDALSLHERGSFSSCVAVLMCMFAGFLEMFGEQELRLEGQAVEVFDWQAGKHNLRAYEAGRRAGIKDQALVMLLKADKGFYTWNAVFSYVIDVVLTNAYDEKVAEHNPLRNKICHGVQTNYGTIEHSLKSILVTDLVLRLGSAIVWSDVGECDQDE